MKKNLFDGFIKEQNVSRELCDKYETLLPGELLDLWKEYGFGNFMDGYLKLINPEEYQELLEETYFRGKISIPILVTAFGDIVTIEEGQYIGMVMYKNGDFVLLAKSFKRFIKNLEDNYFIEKYLEISQYMQAGIKYGNIGHDECFGYVPLLGLGGCEKVENLKKVKVREHILIISQLVGKVGM